MGLAIILGLVISFGFVLAAIYDPANWGSFSQFWNLPSIFIVLGGTVGATLTHFSLPTFMMVGRLVAELFTKELPSQDEVIDEINGYAVKARREGILALEPSVKHLSDPYLRKGLQLTVDGLEPEAIQSILETEINNAENRHSVGIDLFNAMAAYSPALGMIGTVIGLVRMLNNMRDPGQIGADMAIALITTFYGAMLANLVFLPLAGKVRQRAQDEALVMEMQMEGILGISRGENPRIIVEKLTSFQPFQSRRQVD